jgi:predicted nucleic acid-binding protein
MSARVFFDTTILVYIGTKGDLRSPTAGMLLRAGGVISTQVLNEFANVSRKKLRHEWDAIRQHLLDLRRLCEPVLPVTLATHEEALRIAQRYGYSIYDSLMIASALEAGCAILYSEDMQHGQTIGPLTIRNPFLTP